jgi:hypothetical protein
MKFDIHKYIFLAFSITFITFFIICFCYTYLGKIYEGLANITSTYTEDVWMSRYARKGGIGGDPVLKSEAAPYINKLITDVTVVAGEADKAQTTADSAKNDSTTAKNMATGVQNIATKAENTANSANTLATTANTAATAAQTTANSANTLANLPNLQMD